MIWIKYRDNTSASKGTWEYKLVSGDQASWDKILRSYDNLAEMLVEEDIIDTMPWSEDYRGTEAEFVNNVDVPYEEIMDALVVAKTDFISAQQRIELLQKTIGYRNCMDRLWADKR